MSVTNGVVKAPVGLAEVVQLLGGSVLDVGYACTHGNIKKFSRMKPIIHPSPGILTEADMLAANWGFTVGATSIATARANGMVSWIYNKPGANDWKRLTDFDGYDHNSTSPLVFSFNDLNTVFAYDEYGGDSPAILVRARVNATQASQGIGVNGVYLTDMLYGGATTTKLQNLRPCVTRNANGVFFVANASHTLAETSYLDNNVIILQNFNIWKGGWTNSSASDWLGTVSIPSEATDVQYMYLYPRLNVMENVSQLYMDTNGAPSNTVGNNGYFNQNASNPFIGVPQENYLTLIKYKYSPITVELGTCSITYGGGTNFISLWPFLDQTTLSYNSPSIQGLGGRTIPYRTSGSVIVTIECTLYNSASYAITVRPTNLSGGGNAMPNYPIVMTDRAGNTAQSSSGGITVPPSGSIPVTLRINYNTTQFADYTFPSISQPGFGSLYVIPKLRMLVNTTWKEEFTPSQYGRQKALNWR